MIYESLQAREKENLFLILAKANFWRCNEIFKQLIKQPKAKRNFKKLKFTKIQRLIVSFLFDPKAGWQILVH